MFNDYILSIYNKTISTNVTILYIPTKQMCKLLYLQLYTNLRKLILYL